MIQIKKILLIFIAVLGFNNINITAQTNEEKEEIPLWKWVVEPRFTFVDNFSEGLAAVKQTEKYGFIDKTGKWIIEPQFDDVHGFSEGLAAVSKKGKYGFIDKNGQWIIVPQFKNARNFSEGLAAAQKNNKYGFIDKTGKWIIEPQFEDADNKGWVKKNGKWGFLDENRKFTDRTREHKEISDKKIKEEIERMRLQNSEAIRQWAGDPEPENIQMLCNFHEDLAAGMQGKWGFVNKTKKWIIHPQFEYVKDFSEGLVAVKQNGKWGFISLRSAEDYIKTYINKEIIIWQQKDEFESPTAYQQRMATRENEVKNLYKQAVKAYIETPLFGVATSNITISNYDAENHTYLLTSSYLGQMVLKINNVEEARQFKANFENVKYINADYIPVKDKNTGEEKIVISSLTIQNPQNNKQYTWNINDNYKYEQVIINTNFEQVNISQVIGSGNSYEANISTTTTTVGGGQTPQKNVTNTQSDVDINIPKTDATNDKTFAVIIANEDYQYVSPVAFAKNDGETFKKYCIQTLGLPEKNVTFIANATLTNIRREVKLTSQIVETYKGEASIIFYYAGHGVPEEKSKVAYLLPIDGEGRDIKTSGYKLEELYQELSQASAKLVTVFIDACFSGAQRSTGDDMLISERSVRESPDMAAPKGNMVVFSATKNDETACPYKEQAHGMFTYFLLKKLQDTKGNVNYGELGTYITDNVKREALRANRKSQTPTITPSPKLVENWENLKLK